MSYKKKQRIVFIHGFMSGVESTKWKYLTETFGDLYEVVIVETDYKKESPDSINDKLTRFLKYDDIVIGHSLGGFWTRSMQIITGHSSILVNPSLRPSVTLFNGGERSLPSIYKDDYLLLEDCLSYRRNAEIVLYETGDTAVNHKSQIKLYGESEVVAIIGGNHSFLALEEIGNAIERLVNRPWN